jgi:hypothetical protein
MPYSSAKKTPGNFLEDKYSFFSNVQAQDLTSPEIKEDNFEIKELAQQRTQEQGYEFIATNIMLIENEFSQLFATLKQNAVNNKALFYSYCFYCCLMLKYYYEAYEKEEKVAEYKQYLIELENLYAQRSHFSPIRFESFFAALGRRITKEIKELLDIRKLSKLRERVSISNLNRLYWIFCQLTVKNSLLLARDLKWLEKLGNILGKQINVDSTFALLEAPKDVLRALSVGFFAVRFMINAGMLLKHTFFPSSLEKNLGRKKRFTNEIYKRHAVFMNDIVWATVNCVTNYNEFFGISAPMAGWIVAGFLFFDVCLLLWRRHLGEKEYLAKRSQYLFEKESIIPANGVDDECYRVVDEQLRQLDLSWQANDATYLFNITAALMLVTGFSASMLFTTPVAVLGCYMVCTFAVALYFSDGAYKAYKEKSLHFEYAQSVPQEESRRHQAQGEYWEARNNLLFTLAKNAVMPAFFMGLVAICWQAAFILAIGYVCSSLYDSYCKHNQTQQALALTI